MAENGGKFELYMHYTKQASTMWLIQKLRENQDLDLTIVLLQFAGLWPRSPDVKKTLLHRLQDVGIVMTLVLGFLDCTIFLPLGALTSTNDLLAVLECIGAGCLELLSFSKMVCLYYRGDKIKAFTTRIVALRRWDMADHPSEEKQKIFAEIQRWINGLVAMTVVIIVQFNLGYGSLIPTLVAKRKHFSRIWFPVDPYSSPTYEIVFFIWGIRVFITVVGNSCADCLMAATFMHLVGQFRLLSHDFARIRENAVKNVRQQQDNDDVLVREETLGRSRAYLAVQTQEQKALKIENTIVKEKDVAEEMNRIFRGCVYRYQECVRFVREVETLFAPMLVTSMVVSVVSLLAVIIFAGIDPAEFENLTDVVAIETRRAEHIFFMIVYMMVVLALFVELGMCCYMTDLITEESELVRDAVYESDWLAATKRFKKSMMIVMSRANQPLFVRAARFVPLTHETFLGIANLAFSYYTTLRSALRKHESSQLKF